jgi:hypothetical protein
MVLSIDGSSQNSGASKVTSKQITSRGGASNP